MDFLKEDSSLPVVEQHCQGAPLSNYVVSQFVDGFAKLNSSRFKHSSALLKERGVTSQQLAVLQEVANSPLATVTELGPRLHLSQPTVSGVIQRLVNKSLLRAVAMPEDRRKQGYVVTEQGNEVLGSEPTQLSEIFRNKLSALEGWEIHWLVGGLRTLADLMSLQRE